MFHLPVCEVAAIVQTDAGAVRCTMTNEYRLFQAIPRERLRRTFLIELIIFAGDDEEFAGG
jgi:hypothetical protein